MSQKAGFIRSLRRLYGKRRRERRYLEIIRRGEYALPPQSIKLAVIQKNIPNPSPQVFVETGTYFGDTVEAVKQQFAKVISIEVDGSLYEKARERFASDSNVSIILGDCASEIPGVLAKFQEPMVFWLDGHFSGGETGRGQLDDPILVSLNQIATHQVRDHVIFIDDARTFDGREGRPDISEVFNQIKKINNRYIIRVQCDIIIATVLPLPVH